MRLGVLAATAAVLLGASGCDWKGNSAASTPDARASSPAAKAKASSMPGPAGDLVRYTQSGGGAPVAGGSDPGRQMFDGGNALAYADPAVSGGPTRGWGPRPALRYSPTPASFTKDLDLSAPPSPIVGGTADKYASLRDALVRRGSDPKVVDESIRQALAKGMDPLMVLAIGSSESGLRNGQRSSAGALGAMQLMPGTACGLGVCNQNTVRYNVGVNVNLGTNYFQSVWDQFVGSSMVSADPLSQLQFPLVAKAIAAYNAGPGAVQKYGGVPPYAETQAYVRKVVGYYSSFRRYLAQTVSV